MWSKNKITFYKSLNVRFWLVSLIIILCASIGPAQDYDVGWGEAPTTHYSSTAYRRMSMRIEKFRLLILPPCREAVFSACADWSVSLISRGGFEPLDIRMIDDSTAEIKLQLTSDLKYEHLEANYRFPHNFELQVIFDADTVNYHLNYDTLTDSMTIREDAWNAKVKYISLEPTLKIPDDVGWIIFKGNDTKRLREFRKEISSMAELTVVRAGYYKCLPANVEKARLSGFSVNKIHDSYIQFFRIKDHDDNVIHEIMDKYPDKIAFQIE